MGSLVLWVGLTLISVAYAQIDTALVTEMISNNNEELLSAVRVMQNEFEEKIEGMIKEATDAYQLMNNNTQNDLDQLKHLLDTDECTGMTHNCSADARCTDMMVSFRCNCKEGFTGDGYSCEDIDECSDETHKCHKYATCTNTLGGYNCTCFQYFEGDGFNCDGPEEEITGCTEPFEYVPGVGCIHIIKLAQIFSFSRADCKYMNADLFVADDVAHYLRLTQHFVNIVHKKIAEYQGGREIYAEKYMWVGVKDGIWLNGREVAPEEKYHNSPAMDSGTCSYTFGNLDSKFLLFADDCRMGRRAICQKKL